MKSHVPSSRRRIELPLALGLCALLGPAPALAHIQLVDPPPRTAQQKAAPCGLAGGTPGAVMAVYEPGQTLTVHWNETIDHPGHFRLALDPDGGDDAFADPTAYDDLYTNDAVLLDAIPDVAGGAASATVTLPDLECERCTLQLVQVMTDKPPFGPAGGSDFYYQCADIALRRAAVPTDPDPADLLEPSDDTGSLADTATGDTGADLDAADTNGAGDTASDDTGAGEDAARTPDEGGSDDDCACRVRAGSPARGPARGLLLGLCLALSLLVRRRRSRPEVAGKPRALS